MSALVDRPSQRKALVVLDAAMALMVVLLLVQMWLLSATLDTYLAGHVDAALPGALVSGGLFVVCAGIYILVVRLDRQARRH